LWLCGKVANRRGLSFFMPAGLLVSHRQAQKARPKRPAQFPGRGPEAPGRGPAQFFGPPWAGPRPGPVFSRPAQFPGLRPRAQGPPLPHAELPAQRPLCKSKRGVWVKSYARRKVACFAPEFGSKNPPRKVRFGGAHKILSGGPLLRWLPQRDSLKLGRAPTRTTATTLGDS